VVRRSCEYVRLIAKKGWTVFYRGEIALAIVDARRAQRAPVAAKG